MATSSILLMAPMAVPACPIVQDVYQEGSALEGAVFWMFLVIAVMLGIGLVLYLFFVRGSYERERRAALAIVGGRSNERSPGGQDRYRGEPDHTFKGEVPDAVQKAMSSIKSTAGRAGGSGEEVELVDVEEEEGLPAYLYPEPRKAPAPSRRSFPGSRAPAYGGGRIDRPPAHMAPSAPPQRRVPGHIEDLLQEEDRQLLQEEAMAQDQEVPGPLAGEDEVTFEDEPVPYTPTHFPAPRRSSTGQKPTWERVLEEQRPVYEAPIDVAPLETPEGEAIAPEEAEVELVEAERPVPRKEIISGPLADLLLEKDILRSVKEAPKTRPAGAGRKAVAAPARAAQKPRDGPAWTEGRPVFSTPLEAPEVPTNRNNVADRGAEEKLGDLSRRLRAMDEKAGPVLHPKAEAKMGVQEKKFLEAMRAVQQKQHEEERRRDYEGRRLLEEQMRELDRKKKEDEEKRLAEQRRLERERLEQERLGRQQMGRWEEARRSTQEKMRSDERPPPKGGGLLSDEGGGADDEAARQQARRTEQERRKREAAARQSQAATIDDVLSRIGIKK